MGKFYEQLLEELSLYIKQCAWLNTAPTPKKAALSSAKANTSKPPTRMESLQAKGLTPDIPDPGLASYLAGYLFEVGPVAHGGMGAAPISFTELQAWQQATGVDLTPWECKALRRLSFDHIAAGQDAQDEDSPAPYAAPITEDRRSHVADAVRNIFGSRKTH